MFDAALPHQCIRHSLGHKRSSLLKHENRRTTHICAGVGAKGAIFAASRLGTRTELFNNLWLPQYENQDKRPRNAPYQDARNENIIHDV